MFLRLYLVICLSLSSFNLLAETPAREEKPPEAPSADMQMQETVSRLQDIRDTLKEKRSELDDLQKQLRKTKEASEIADLTAQQDELRKAISKLNQSFEQVATGGLDVSALAEQPIPEFDWKKELVVVTKPLLDSLKDLTEKPRQIDQLRNEILRLENLLKITQKAHSGLEKVQQQALSKSVREKLETVVKSWQKREADVVEALEMARYQLNSLNTEKTTNFDSIQQALREFFHGRGTTLLMALLAALAIWLSMWLLRKLVLLLYRPQQKPKAKVRWRRIIYYSFNLLTALLVVFAVITIFYARNDLLLLMLMILLLLMFVFSLRMILPRYLAEIRMLLNMGPVRQDERILYQGVPYHVRTLNVFSTLMNPELDGVLRLPSNVLNSLASRPRTDEPWFPSRPGDYVMLPGEVFAEVVKQSVETVQLKVRGSTVNMPTADFFNANVRNLSREGFVVVAVFGVDYQHQADCLTRIPDTLRSALENAFASYDYQPTDLLVEFKEAGASSLDYIIVAAMNGEAAGAYFGVGRLIHKTCVEVCNRENWVIPFQQMTVHQGEGFAALAQASAVVSLSSEKPPISS